MPQVPAVIELSALDGSNGFQINGQTAYDFLGTSVSSAGDVNGDGFEDLIIGAPYAHPNSPSLGAAYVVFGDASGFGADFNLSTLDGTNGFQINGGDAYPGRSVSAAGDVNGDGFDDIILTAVKPITAIGFDSRGEAYVIFGKASGFGATLDLTGLNGSNGFRVDPLSTDDYGWLGVAGAGDINGDGFDDLIIGDYAGANYAGTSYVVFGKASGFGAHIELPSLSGAGGFHIDGETFGDLT